MRDAFIVWYSYFKPKGPTILSAIAASDDGLNILRRIGFLCNLCNDCSDIKCASPNHKNYMLNNFQKIDGALICRHKDYDDTSQKCKIGTFFWIELPELARLDRYIEILKNRSNPTPFTFPILRRIIKSIRCKFKK